MFWIQVWNILLRPTVPHGPWAKQEQEVRSYLYQAGGLILQLRGLSFPICVISAASPETHRGVRAGGPGSSRHCQLGAELPAPELMRSP